ncbi:hypothetical protein F5Y14DRAFT_413598 [Nemania sp. NC0429]|nr:hypothetical protein F5Y14DRAFT_413598 [Nemania sp. NC0429]
MATGPDEHALLTRAIDNADAGTLRTVLKSMCRDSETCRKEATQRLVVSRKHEIIELSDSDDDAEGQDKKRKKKVKVMQEPRFETCKTCDKTYDVTLNNDTACQTHEDLLVIDAEYFPDDDQVMYEPHSIDVNTDWRRKAVPEGFRWQCCDESVNGEACVIQRHIPKKQQASTPYMDNKRRFYMS